MYTSYDDIKKTMAYPALHGKDNDNSANVVNLQFTADNL